MATYVTSFVCTEPIPNRWVRMQARTFAMVAIANPPCACSLVLSSPASSPYTNLAALVRRHSAGTLKLLETPKICLSPRGVGFAMHSEARGFTIASLGESTHGYPNFSSQSAR